MRGIISAAYGFGLKANIRNEFKSLETVPALHSSDHLNRMYELANKKEEHEYILGHIYKWDKHLSDTESSINLLEVESYATLERKIVDRYWK